MSYKVYVDDNFHYMEEEHRMTAGKLIKLYCLCGEDPFIMHPDTGFSGRDYARDQVGDIPKESGDFC
jgi:hypothetical protein